MKIGIRLLFPLLGFVSYLYAQVPGVPAMTTASQSDLGRGYRVALLQKGKPSQDFITGFLDGLKVNGRPCDIMRFRTNGFLITDDKAGLVYYFFRKQS